MNSSAMSTIDFGGEAINFSVSRTSRRKTVAISVGYEGVRVLAPLDLDDGQICSIIRAKGAWVLRKQAGYRELGSEPVVREFVSGETFYYLGRPYRLRISVDESAKLTRITTRGYQLLATIPEGVDVSFRSTTVRSGLRFWFKERAKVRLKERTRLMARTLGVPTPSVTVVEQSKRWGSCDAKGQIRINWRLIMAPMSLIDYVIAHEICHTLEHNHSRQFWRLLETMMPDYETRARQLDKFGHLCTL